MKQIFMNVFGSRNERVLSSWSRWVKEIAEIGEKLKPLSDEKLRTMAADMRRRAQNGEKEGALLTRTFALAREMSTRLLGLRHFDVQLLGGIALWSGKIAEMRTGEGKTLVATLPVILSALSGKGVHVATANEYLASRDAQTLRPLYEAFGFTVGVTVPGMSNEDKQAAYECDIVYGTANEFGFDWLRDRMAMSVEQKIQKKGLNFCIVDEVDSILIDEARTPLIISGAKGQEHLLLQESLSLAKMLSGIPYDDSKKEQPKNTDFLVDLKTRDIILTEQGHEKIEREMRVAGMIPQNGNPYTSDNIHAFHAVLLALRSLHCFEKDKDYVVLDNKVVIVDEFTGRMSHGRRWQDGLHEAIETKEGIEPEESTSVLGSISFQNYFRMYKRLSGMTGTADTEAYEFHQIYGLETIVVPTNRPSRRKDHPDLIFRTSEERNTALAKFVAEEKQKGRPILIGTPSVGESEEISRYLTKFGLEHSVLNAKNHAREANIIADAGRPGRITVATNMAGRGTDIVLGGVRPAEEDSVAIDQWRKEHSLVMEMGGLLVIGTSRHETRRIDNQLRGRCARQGDPGETYMFLSLEDPIMVQFGGNRVSMLLDRINHPKGEPLSHPLVTKSMNTAQKRVEGHNFNIRKHLLSYDDVLQEQRLVFYSERDSWLEQRGKAKETLLEFAHEAFKESLPGNPDEMTAADWHVFLFENWAIDISEDQFDKWIDEDKEGNPSQKLLSVLQSSAQAQLDSTGDSANHFAHSILLSVWDELWRGHLSAMDNIRQSINLRAYAQKDPKKEYKEEAYKSFAWMASSARKEMAQVLLSLQVVTGAAAAQTSPLDVAAEMEGAGWESLGQMEGINRNSLCPCGSGLRYKHCHGKLS